MPRTQQHRGFTLIEMLVVIGITTLLASLFLANYREGEKSRNVRIAADSVTSALRLMQNNALAGLTPPNPPSGGVLRAYMLEIDTASNSRYQTNVEFKDARGVIISPPTLLETINFAANVYIDEVKIIDRGVESALSGQLVVRFFPPFGKIKIQNLPAGERENVSVRFKLKHADPSYERAVTIDAVSGRIEVR